MRKGNLTIKVSINLCNSIKTSTQQQQQQQQQQHKEFLIVFFIIIIYLYYLSHFQEHNNLNFPPQTNKHSKIYTHSLTHSHFLVPLSLNLLTCQKKTQ